MMMSQSDAQHSYTVKIENDKAVSAEVDVKQVPKDRIRRHGNSVQILDEDGSVLKSFHFQAMGGMAPAAPFAGQMRMQGGPGANTLQIQPAQPGWQAQEAFTPPPVMMGITMSDPGDGENGIIVDTVIDGLPAEKAGLEPGDRIVSADGKELTAQQRLRSILKDKKPGDSLDLKVIRDGKEKSVTLKLAKYEAKSLPQGGTTTWPDLAGGTDHAKVFEEAKAALQKALEEIKSNENLKADKIKAKAEKALNEAMDALEDAKKKMSDSMSTLHDQLAQGGWTQFFGNNNGSAHSFVIPPTAPMAPAAPDADVTRQLEKLSQQLDKLNRRLDQLEKEKK
jgi:hypothetical protein